MKSAYVKVNCRKFKGQGPLPTLSMEDARQKVANLLTDHLQLKVEGYAADTQTVCDVLVKASVEGRAIEGTCNDLKDVPTGHTVRTCLNDQLKPADLLDIEAQVNLPAALPVCRSTGRRRRHGAALTADVPKRVWKKRRDAVVDLHDEPFYLPAALPVCRSTGRRRRHGGKSPELMPYACRGEAQKGTTYFYRVASLYVIFHNVPVTLAVMFVLPQDSHLSASLQAGVAILKRLLLRARRTGLSRRCLLLDKGFCNIPTITYLQQARIPAIIPACRQTGLAPSGARRKALAPCAKAGKAT